MALKDLISSADSVRENDIEEIVAETVRFDTKRKSLVLTSAGTRLSNKAKVLTLLVANAGWVYVDPDVSPMILKPKTLEDLTGIAGGTLRPMLISLKKQRLVSADGGAYQIVAPNLPAIRDEIFG
ncbi:MAG TPA: hypothetical protein VGN68_06450 [Sphingopyxis sp.]|jgi:hypothetical protein|uniref:hypothetical protein n=1 Tax=Sphingopyxis sp. TaxID=1908224 RepID=UPI002E0E3160|nr:hypothetical protein [Sphingopyxis sp.]